MIQTRQRDQQVKTRAYSVLNVRLQQRVEIVEKMPKTLLFDEVHDTELCTVLYVIIRRN